MQPRYYGTPRLPLRITVIEIMVVLLILGIFAAIVFPTFARCIQRARIPTCLGNAHVLAVAAQMYAEDYNDHLPGAWSGAAGVGQGGGWMFYTRYPNGRPGGFQPAQGSLYPYVKQLSRFSCPQDTTGQENSYALNARLTRGGAGFHPGLRSQQVRRPAVTVLFAEESAAGATTDDGYLVPAGAQFAARHAGRTTFAFLDGHASQRAPGSIPYPNPRGTPRFDP